MPTYPINITATAPLHDGGTASCAGDRILRGTSMMGVERTPYVIGHAHQIADEAFAFIEGPPVSDSEKTLIAHGNVKWPLGL